MSINKFNYKIGVNELINLPKQKYNKYMKKCFYFEF